MSAREGPPTVLPWPPRPPRRFAGIPIGLMVCWQAALLLALLAIGRPTGHVIVLGIGAAVLIAVTGCRPRGRWTHEWVVLWLRYLLRSLRETAPPQPPSELALVDLAAGLEAVEDVEIEGHDTAVVFHTAGATAVMELDVAAVTPDLARLPLTLAPPHDPDAPMVSVQLVVYGAAAGAGLPTRAWLAIQVRRDAGYQRAELRGALVGAVRRLQRRLRPEGLAAPALDRTRVLEALHVTACLELAGPVPPDATDPVGTEQWSVWWTRGVPQTSLAVRQWPGAPEPPGDALLHVLAQPPCPQTVSVAAQRLAMPTGHGAVGAGDGVLAVEVLVRLAGRDRSTLEHATKLLCDRLAATGARVERLDGRQLPGLAATLPLGGFLPGYAPSASTFAPPPKAARPRPAAPEPPPAAPPAPPPPAATPAPAPPPPVSTPAPARPLTPAATGHPGQTSAPRPEPVAAGPPPTVTEPPATQPVAEPVAAEPVATPLPTAQPSGTPVEAPRSPEPIEVRPMLPEPEPATADAGTPAPLRSPEPALARGQAHIPIALTAPSPARGQAHIPIALTAPSPARGQARIPSPAPVLGRAAPALGSAPTPTPPVHAPVVRGHAEAPTKSTPEPAGIPTALRGAAGSSPPPEPADPAASGTPQSSYPQMPPDLHRAVRAYGASLFTVESPRRAQMEQLVALARTPHATPQAVSVLSGTRGVGASMTAAGLAQTLATVRDDHTALLSVAAGSAGASSILQACQSHVFTIIDLGAHVSETTPQALALSTRVLVVTSADRHATATTRRILDQLHQVRPALVPGAVVAVVCRTARQYRRILRELSNNFTPPAAQIIPIPPDPGLRTVEYLDLAQLHPPTREAYLRLAASLAIPPPATAAPGSVHPRPEEAT